MLKLRKILLSSKLYYLLLTLVFIYLIIYLSFFKLKNKYKNTDNTFELKIKKYKIDGDKLTIEFNNLIGIYYFKNEKEKESFDKLYSLNDLIKIECNLKEPNNNTIQNTFNYKKYLEHKNIKYIININNIKLLKKNNNIFYYIKNIIYKRISNINNAYLYAFILGDSSYIDRNIYNNYKTNGITHLFALSGLHISIFSSIIMYILNKIKFNEKLSFIITSLFLIFFSFIASFTPSILRATIFFILSNINKIYYFFIKPKHLLYLTFIILVIINPNYIFYTGFILSFTITFFILIYNENNKSSSILKISLLSFLSSLPIIINLSYEINIIGFINNLFFIPYVSNIVFPLSLLTIIFDKLIGVLNIFLRLMERVSIISSEIININIYFPKISNTEIIIYYLLLILIIKKKNKLKILFVILILFMYLKPYLNKNNYIYYIDVGQGDCILIVTKNNKSVLIDTGGIIQYEEPNWKKQNNNFNLMTSNIIPFFKSIGLKKIDYLLLTHGDYDHMGYAVNLVENFKVENVIFNCGEYNDLEKELIIVLDKKKIEYYSCIKELDIDKYKLNFLQTKEYDNENDNSNVIYTNIDGVKMIFMGDAGVNTEKEILEKYNITDIDILKVGHHGSDTSSSKDFINEIRPDVSIISVGKNNKYGHPKNSVLDTLKESKIYRTDLDGSIEIKINKGKYKVRTCSP